MHETTRDITIILSNLKIASWSIEAPATTGLSSPQRNRKPGSKNR